MIFIWIIIGLVLIALIISFYENRHFKIKKYEIADDYFKDCQARCVFISDLHDCKYGHNNVNLIKDIDSLKPDFVIFGGDIFNGIRNKNNENAGDFIKAVSDKYKCVYALGNHEFRYYLYPDDFPGCKKVFEETLRNCNIKLLDNDCERVVIDDKKIDIFGLSIERKYYKRFKPEKMSCSYTSEVLPPRDENVFSVLLAHNPKYYKEYCGFGANLILSGHYHGGIMRVFNQGFVGPDFSLFPRYAYGLCNKDKSTMIVSGGMGVHTIPFRIFNRPELVVIDFKG